MKSLSTMLIFLIIVSISFSQSVDIKDSADHTLITINDEGDTGGSITIPDATSITTSTNNKLYNLGGSLNWNGSALGTGGSSLWGLNGSDIYYNSGKVGIGLTDPSYIFTVYTNNDVGALFQNSATGTTMSDGFWVGYQNDRAYIHNIENTPLRLGTNNQIRMHISEDGNVGIGTTTPEGKLDVAGRININHYRMVDLPNQTDFEGTMFFGGGSAGYQLSNTGGEYSGKHNIGIGRQAMFNITTGYDNVFIGDEAGRDITDGRENTFIGWGAGQGNTSAISNCIIGNAAGMWNTGNYNVYLGSGAGHGSDGGDYNTFLGAGAGGWHSNGSNNVMIGRYSGYDNLVTSTNEGCVFIGYHSGRFEKGNNKLIIENSDSSTPLIGGDFSTDRIGINTVTPSVTLEISGTDAVQLTTGTTAQRPAIPAVGMIRYNTETNKFEGYTTGSIWVDLH